MNSHNPTVSYITVLSACYKTWAPWGQQVCSSLHLWCRVRYWSAPGSCGVSCSCDNDKRQHFEVVFKEHRVVQRPVSTWSPEQIWELFLPLQLMSISHFRAEGSSKIQARMEQQPPRPPQPSQPPPPPPPMPFRAPTKPPVGPKTSPLKDNPSPEPQLDDIKRGRQHFLEHDSKLEWNVGVFVAITRVLYWPDSTGIFCHWKKFLQSSPFQRWCGWGLLPVASLDKGVRK